MISADQNPLCFSSQSEGTGSVSAVNAVDGAFNSDGFNLHIDQHSENIKNLTKSPGDGFLMASRPMFQHCSEEKEQQASLYNGQLVLLIFIWCHEPYIEGYTSIFI